MLTDKKYLYFIGIGGIGMSAIARYFKSEGYDVSGYDKTTSSITDQLFDEGINVQFEDDWSLIDGIYMDNPKHTLIIYTPAIPSDNHLFIKFKSEGFDMVKRAQILGFITQDTVNLSIAGTHGKTTTSSIVASIFMQSEVSFSAFLGGISANLNSNYYKQEGLGRLHTITEADEFDRSFMHLRPNFVIITSTDADHLDIYKDKNDIENSYVQFSQLVAEREFLFFAKNAANRIIGCSYSATDPTADYYATNLKKSARGTYFDLMKHGDEVLMTNLYISLPGMHNLENAIGAILVTLKSGMNWESIKKGLASFKGIKRRFEYIIERDNFIFIDDYAHHPSELKAIINSIQNLYPNQHITAIFQPHLYSRTQDFMGEFAQVLEKVDRLILLPIYAAREKAVDGVSSDVLLQKIDIEHKICLEKSEVIPYLKEHKIEILLTIGAGDIDQLVQPIADNYGQ